MHIVHLTPDLMKRAIDLAIRGFVVLPDHTHAPIDAISDGTTTQAILGAAARRVRVGDMTDDALASVDQRTHNHLINELIQQGHPATMDSIVSLVTWERFATTPGALCEEFVHDRPMQSDAVYDDQPEIALERFLQPLATAKVGQPVGVSLPYDAQTLSGVRDDICTSMMRVIGVGKNGFAISPLDSLPSSFVQRVVAWAQYGIATNDWNLATGRAAIDHLRAYAKPLTFESEVFFFRDRAIAIADVPERLVMTAIGADNPANSAHHDLAAIPKIQEVVTLLRNAPLVHHPYITPFA